MNTEKPKILVILGPTSSGKSDLAIKVAKKFDGEIISADSRQIYRGMDLGTGKVTKGEQKMAKHWMLDIINPNTNFSAAQFKKKAEKIIQDILNRGKLPIICGGTGFWIKSLVDNITFPEVKPDWKLRKNLQKKSIQQLFSMLKKLDLERSESIDAKNKVRLIRAIEICKTLGKVPKFEEKNNNYQFLQIGINVSKEKLHKRIKIRLEKRFQLGMIKEVEKLHKIGKVSWKRLESFGLEYKSISLYLQKKISEAEMKQNLLQASKDYAKRQMTWFRKDKGIVWIKNYEEAEKVIEKFID